MLYENSLEDNNTFVVKERDIIIPKSEKTIGIQNDTNSKQIKLIVPRYFEDKDLSKHTFLLKTVSRGGRSDILFSEENKIVQESEVILNWNIQAPVTSFYGIVKIQLVVFSKEFKWQTNISEVNVLKTLDANPVIPSQEDYVEELILQFESKTKIIEENILEIKNLLTLSNENVEESNKLLNNSIELKNEIDGIKNEAMHYAEFSQQCSILAQKIKDSTEIFYDVDKNLYRIGFKRANEESFTYTPNLKGEKGDRVEMRRGETHIQWKYTNETEWKNLISLEELGVVKNQKLLPNEEDIALLKSINTSLTKLVQHFNL